MLKNDSYCCIVNGMKTKAPKAIRVTITPEVGRALKRAKSLYPTLSDPEILKLGLAKISTSDVNDRDKKERAEIMAIAANSVGYDYLSDPEEDIYTEDMGEKVNFS